MTKTLYTACSEDLGAEAQLLKRYLKEWPMKSHKSWSVNQKGLNMRTRTKVEHKKKQASLPQGNLHGLDQS